MFYETKPIGSERFNNGYLIRKVASGKGRLNWKFVHHILWEEAGREIPPGHVLYFKDGDKTNLTLENIGITTKQEYGVQATAIRTKIYRDLKIKTRKITKDAWTPEMDAEMVRLYFDTPNKIIAAKLNRTVPAIKVRAKILGLRKESIAWTYEDDKKLAKIYPKMRVEKVAEILGRTIDAVYARACQNGLEKIRQPSWTLEQDSFLIKNYHKMRNDEIGNALEKDTHDLRKRALKLGLLKSYRWTYKEEFLLHQLYPEMTVNEISTFLNRPTWTIYSRIAKFNKAKKSQQENIKKRKKWTKKEDTILRQLYPIASNKDIAKHLHRSLSSVKSRINVIGLRRDETPRKNALLDEFVYRHMLRVLGNLDPHASEKYGTKTYLLNTVKKGDYRPRPRREPSALALAFARARARINEERRKQQ